MGNTNKSPSFDSIFVPLLQVALIVLKLCEVINWSWVWVLAPAWGILGLSLLLLFGAFVVACIKSCW